MRLYTAGQIIELEAAVVRHARLVELELPAATLRYNDSAVDLIYGGNTYFGAGDLLSIEFPEEDLSMAANTASISISGVTAAVASLALRTPMAGRPMRIYHALFDDQWQMVGAPTLMHRLRISHATMTNEGSGSG